MRNRVIQCLLALGLVVAGCSATETIVERAGTSATSESIAGPTTAPAAASPAESNDATESTADDKAEVDEEEALAATAHLEAMALTIEEMPAGWFEMPATATGEATSFCPDSDVSIDIDSAEWPSVEYQFGETAFGPLLAHVVMEAPDAETASQLIEQTAAAVAACPAWTDSGGSYELMPVTYPAAGDEHFAARMFGDSAGVIASFDVVLIREDVIVSLLFAGGLGSTADEALVAEWMATLDERD